LLTQYNGPSDEVFECFSIFTKLWKGTGYREFLLKIILLKRRQIMRCITLAVEKMTVAAIKKDFKSTLTINANASVHIYAA